MIKKLFIALSAGSLSLFLCTACAEDSTESNADTEVIAEESTSLMTQPVDFSSADAVEATMENIREKEGDQAHAQLKNAMQYIMVYDLSVGNDKEKLYKKLNGRTPEQIIAKIKR
jgi:succinate dehydrogenase/fumarate reductase flavoprotein subunit